MKKVIILLLLVVSVSCAQETPKQFSAKALNDTFITLNNKEVSFKKILEKYRGKTILIDIWASWCGDCIKGMPKVVALQKEYPEVVYLFLSLDKSLEDWKVGIKKYNVKGEHYFLTSGWEGEFGSFVNIDWIPRYMVIDTQGNIKLFKSVHADDNKIIESLKK